MVCHTFRTVAMMTVWRPAGLSQMFSRVASEIRSSSRQSQRAIKGRVLHAGAGHRHVAALAKTISPLLINCYEIVWMQSRAKR
jgi:hypothetical protein